MRKLSVAEINHALSLPTVNNRKDYLQNLVIQEWFKSPNGVFEGFTSIGKSYCIAKVIKLLNQQQPDATTCIIVPATDLKEDFEKTVAKFELKNVEVHVINSFSMNLVNNSEDKYYDLLVADELHTLCGESSKYFSEIIPRVRRKYFFGVSATLENPHIEYLQKFGLRTFFSIPLEDGFRSNVVPEYIIYNIPVHLDEAEKVAYQQIQKQYQAIVNYFMQVDVHKPVEAINALLVKKTERAYYGGRREHSQTFAQEFGVRLDKDPGFLIFKARQWQKLVGQRRILLNNCKNSIRMLARLAVYINKPTLLVCASTEVADYLQKYLPDSACYHSKIPAKQRKKNKDDFTKGIIKYLLVVKGLKMGYNKDDLQFLVRQGYASKPLDLTQYLGRLLRPDKNNPDKFSILVNIYVEDFMVGGTKVESQQKKWLKSSLYRRGFVEWINDITEIEL